MKRIAFLASFMGIFLLVASIAYAHGGSYSGPAGGGTGGGFAPSGGGTPGPGPGPAGGGTGGGGSPGGGGTTGGGSTGPGGGGSSGPPGGVPGGGAPGGGGAVPGAGGVTGGRKPPKTDANLTWAGWWFFNDDRYLNLKATIRNEKNETENADLFTGASDQTEEITTVNAKMIREKINPVLKYALKDGFYDTRAAALIALGKTGSPDALEDLKSLMDDENKFVRESSFLAMGILGNKEAIPQLIEVMTDSKAGRKLVGRKNGVLNRTRAFAALAIGLIGSRHADLSDTQAVSALLDQMNAKEGAQRDIQVGPIVALGIMRCKEAVPDLIKFFKTKSNNAVVRSYVATSLGKIGDPAAVKVLLKGLKDKQNAVTQSCAMALGLLAKPDNVDVVKGLQKLVKSSPDLGAKNFAIISMGEIGGQANLSELIRMARKGNLFMRTFSSMALAVYMDKNKADPERVNVCKRLHKYFKSEKNLDVRGANAIALGIMRYTEAGEDILNDLKKGGQAELRSHLCIALGLMDYDAAIKEVRETVTDKGNIELRRNAAIALGLLGDKGALKVLEEEMSNSARSKAVHGAVTQGLGFIGDVSAVPILVKFVRDRQEYQNVTRAFAAVALGLLGDKDNIPVLSKISMYNNYLQRTDALKEVLTIL